MKASAILVAAGSGTRLGLGMPKAFLSIDGFSLLSRVLRTLGTVEALDEVVLAVPAGAQNSARAEINAAGLQIPVKITVGGRERQDSVRIALMLTSAEAELIVVHDVARPFATASMFSACINAAALSGGAIVAIPIMDTVKRVDKLTIFATATREGLWLAQTPQAFRRDLLTRAHELAMRDQIRGTDDAQLVERMGATVEVVQGSALNLKITTPEDLTIAEAIARFVVPR